VGLLIPGLEPPFHLVEPRNLRRWLSWAGVERLSSFGRIWLAKARLDRRRWQEDPKATLDLLRRLRAEAGRNPPLRVEDLAVNGRDLIQAGLRPGPYFGDILDRLLDRVLEDPTLNERASLLALLEAEGWGEGVTDREAHDPRS